MDELEKQEQPEQEQPEQDAPQYVPRPAWQVWLARIGLVIFLGFLILYYINFFRGGA